MSKNIVRDKSFRFAVDEVNICRNLRENRKESVLSGQLLKSGSFVGASIRESEHAESRNDSIHKMAIAQKEINETIYGLELLFDTGYITTTEFETLNSEALQLIKRITSIIKTAKINLRK
jgi:four helix bundle protein